MAIQLFFRIKAPPSLKLTSVFVVRHAVILKSNRILCNVKRFTRINNNQIFYIYNSIWLDSAITFCKMIVKNVITIVFVVITGAAFVRGAVAAFQGKHRLKLRKDEIGYKSDNDALLRALSDFGVVRRSLNPMMYEIHYSSNNIQYWKDKQNIPNVKSRKNVVIEKLKLSVTFRDNVLYIFSYLLYGADNGLTEAQYESLRTLYEILKKKMVYMYNLLPTLSKLDTTADKNQQTSIILLSLAKNLPAYIQCAAKYLASEIELYRIDLNMLLQPTEFDTFDYLANIDLGPISKGKIRNEEMIGYDQYSNITEKALGPVFVKLLHNLQTNNPYLSQDLFGLILINLPNLSEDPVLEENIRFLYDLTKNNGIDQKIWDSIRKDLVGSDVYTLVFTILTKILNSNVPMIIKDAAGYVYHHLKLVTVPTYVNSNFKYMNHLTEKDMNIVMLLSAIIPQDFDVDVIRMKNSLLTYLMHNYRSEDMNKILKGFNKFAYNDPLDLLLAFITRLTNRVPSIPNSQILRQSATVLLPALIMKKYSRIFTPFVSPEVDVLILLESIKTPDTDAVFQSTVDSVKIDLIAQPQISVLLSTLIPTEKDKCEIPKQCLINTFQQVQKLQNNIPLPLMTKIQNIVYTLLTKQPQQPSQNYPTQYSIKPIDVNIYLDREKPIAVAIETGSTYTNVPSSFNGVPYVWNIDKYVGNPTVPGEVQERPSEWKIKVPLYVKPEEAKSVDDTHSTTTDQIQITEAQVTEGKGTKPKIIETHITEYGSTREVTSDRPVTMEPLLTTSRTPSLIPTQRPQKKETQYTPTTPTEPIRESSTFEERDSEITYTSEQPIRESSTFEERDSEMTYTSEQTSELIFHEKEESHPSTSEEIEDVTPSLREITNEEVTMKESEMDTATRTQLPQGIEERTSNENVSNAIVLPPTIETDQPLKVQLSHSGVPVVVTTDEEISITESETEIILPEIKELLKPAEINELMQDTYAPIVSQVLQPLSIMFGENYVKKILKENSEVYPTNIALLSAILKKAVIHPEVKKNSQLISIIHKYISAIDYVSPTILLPIVVSSRSLVSNVTYSTFNPNGLTNGTIDEMPPVEPLSDTITIPLVNPKILLQSINPSAPYADLLPTLEKGNTLALTIQPLKMLLTPKKITEILGPDFQPLVYPNKGALLITILHKLQKSEIIQSNPKLKSLVDIYIQAIEIPSMSIQVSEDKLVKMKSETTGQWQPELTSLISALPTAGNNAEATMIQELERFLGDPTLLEKLQIDKPPLLITRGELLSKIILSALSGKIRLEQQLLKVLIYYKDKVKFANIGALPIMWMWVETYTVKAEVQLGNMIQKTVNFNELPYKKKLAYNDLMTYLAQNPNLLQDNEGFDFEKYKTQGQFIKGLFKYLLKKPEVHNKIKKNIQLILPRVSLTGAGAIVMPRFF